MGSRPFGPKAQQQQQQQRGSAWLSVALLREGPEPKTCGREQATTLGLTFRRRVRDLACFWPKATWLKAQGLKGQRPPRPKQSGSM